MAKKYKYANAAHTAVNDTERGIYGITPGLYLWWEEVQSWVAQGNTIEDFETPQELQAREALELSISKLQSEAEAIKENPALKALVNMTPVQVGQWIDSNVTSLASAKDVIKTLAMAVCILARRL